LTTLPAPPKGSTTGPPKIAPWPEEGSSPKIQEFILQLVGGFDDYLFSMETDRKKLVSRVLKKTELSLDPENTHSHQIFH
jgi:hypothetical protein